MVGFGNYPIMQQFSRSKKIDFYIATFCVMLTICSHTNFCNFRHESNRYMCNFCTCMAMNSGLLFQSGMLRAIDILLSLYAVDVLQTLSL